MARRAWLAGTALLLVGPAAVLAGCGGDDDPGADGDGTTTTSPADDPLAGLSAFDDLGALATAVGDAGFACELEYEGLEDETGVVSLCTIGDGQATLRIWNDPADVADLATSEATDLTVYGRNWTIDLRDPSVAAGLAESLGGRTG